jgi:hypothetical protein
LDFVIFGYRLRADEPSVYATRKAALAHSGRQFRFGDLLARFVQFAQLLKTRTYLLACKLNDIRAPRRFVCDMNQDNANFLNDCSIHGGAKAQQ